MTPTQRRLCLTRLRLMGNTDAALIAALSDIEMVLVAGKTTDIWWEKLPHGRETRD